MELKETIEMMNSSDYKERFRAEYHQLKNRYDGLCHMLEKYKDDTLTFKPKCSYTVLDNQKNQMFAYLRTLEFRAEIENIDLGGNL